MTGPTSGPSSSSYPDLERLRVEGELRLREAELEFKRREQENTRKTAALSSPVIVAIFSALFGVLGTGLGAGLQGYWNASLEQQKFEYGLLERALATDDNSLAAKRLLFLARSGIINRLDRTQIEQMAAEPSQLPLYDQGKLAGVSARKIINAVEAYRQTHGAYPDTLTRLSEEYPQIENEISLLGKTKIQYTPDPDRGYIFKFAGQDGYLGTPDDKIHDKTGLTH
ncbi:hypothetical protein [Myxococcus sp. Y35]|uniref:hypothetical protein n=1 Tax=Pseudomyxococcus flavus TaxID=3115648 RepID=UPI003CE7846C